MELNQRVALLMEQLSQAIVDNDRFNNAMHTGKRIGLAKAKELIRTWLGPELKAAARDEETETEVHHAG